MKEPAGAQGLKSYEWLHPSVPSPAMVAVRCVAGYQRVPHSHPQPLLKQSVGMCPPRTTALHKADGPAVDACAALDVPWRQSGAASGKRHERRRRQARAAPARPRVCCKHRTARSGSLTTQLQEHARIHRPNALAAAATHPCRRGIAGSARDLCGPMVGGAIYSTQEAQCVVRRRNKERVVTRTGCLQRSPSSVGEGVPWEDRGVI